MCVQRGGMGVLVLLLIYVERPRSLWIAQFPRQGLLNHTGHEKAESKQSVGGCLFFSVLDGECHMISCFEFLLQCFLSNRA